MDAAEIALPAETADGRARRAALDVAPARADDPVDAVAYRSEGGLLVIGAGADALPAAAALEARLRCTVILPRAERDAGAPAHDAGAVRRIHADVTRVEGHLGDFRVFGDVDGEEVAIAPSLLTAHRPFDLVLDLAAVPRIDSELPPPGYLAPGTDPQARARALAELPELVGEFEKPRYFRYDPAICAHGERGQRGCTRCLDACPADAIRSIGERVEVDPHLCQGAGACASVCPTGAITYALPGVADQLDRLRRALARYRESGGSAPIVLFHDAEAGRAWLAANAASLPERVIPCEVEEIGSVGLDAWLALVAYGARVRLLCPPPVPRRSRAALDAQLGYADAILAGMGLPRGLVALAPVGDDAGPDWDALPGDPALEPATFAAVGEKRTDVRLAVEHLWARAPAPAAEAELPAGAPFGEIRVDRDRCTLCMACASVCPAGAVLAGDESPKLRFVEWNCVQCGLCEGACPEDAIRLHPRFVYDPERRRETRTLNEDAPFRCVSCGKVFGTTRVIGAMREKLAGHWMFQSPEALRRLEMCENCRVEDVFRDGGGTLET